jgi:hypothetical protein
MRRLKRAERSQDKRQDPKLLWIQFLAEELPAYDYSRHLLIS